MKKENMKFEDWLLSLIITYSYMFLGYAYYVTTDLTIKGVILTAVISTLGIAINWKFGSSKSSANKDEVIKSMQDKDSQTINTENVETVKLNN